MELLGIKYQTPICFLAPIIYSDDKGKITILGESEKYVIEKIKTAKNDCKKQHRYTGKGLSILQVKRYWYSNINSWNYNISQAAIKAKLLGKTYREDVKENLTFKSKNVMRTLEIKRVLIPTDFSETGALAMEHAIHMARLFNAELYLLHVVEVYEYTYSIYDPDVRIHDTEEIHDSINDKLEKMASEISKANGINVSVLVGSGRPASGIAEAVKENKIDLIIMGTHGAKGFEELFIGSNAHKVVNMAPCPVITIQKHATNLDFKNILMPIDDTPHSRQKVDYVTKIASKYGAKVHILGLQNSDEEIDEKRFKIKLESVENAVKKAKLPYDLKVKKGKNIAEEAMKYSDEVGADLIVIMTDHESNLTGMFLGSFSKQIVNHSRIPVMSIRPEEGYYGGYYPFGAG